MSADETVNVHDAYSIGEEGLLKDMDGQTTSEYVIKKKHQTINFASKNKVNINENYSFSVDPKLLFQRLIVMTDDYSVTLKEALQYELTSFPLSIFEDANNMSHAYKSALADEVDRMYNHDKLCTPEELPPIVTRFVLDGGSLIQSLQLQKKSTFQHIIGLYSNFKPH